MTGAWPPRMTRASPGGELADHVRGHDGVAGVVVLAVLAHGRGAAQSVEAVPGWRGR